MHNKIVKILCSGIEVVITGLTQNQLRAIARGFESLPLRQKKSKR